MAQTVKIYSWKFLFLSEVLHLTCMEEGEKQRKRDANQSLHFSLGFYDVRIFKLCPTCSSVKMA